MEFADENIAITEKKDILVPLTNSLYVKGKLSDPDKVIVDVGTGFYIEKVRTVSHFPLHTSISPSHRPVKSSSPSTNPILS